MAALALVAGAALVGGCKQEPTIVIKFEPNDMSGARAAAATAGDLGGRAADLGGRAADLGGKKTAADAPGKPGGKAETAAKETAGKPGAAAKGKAAECKVASDCVLEPADCCDCANGGKQHAIAKARAAASQAARQQRCKETACTMMLSTDPTCGMRADCVDGQCVMVKK